jgi:hypothetical protein
MSASPVKPVLNSPKCFQKHLNRLTQPWSDCQMAVAAQFSHRLANFTLRVKGASMGRCSTPSHSADGKAEVPPQRERQQPSLFSPLAKKTLKVTELYIRH